MDVLVRLKRIIRGCAENRPPAQAAKAVARGRAGRIASLIASPRPARRSPSHGS